MNQEIINRINKELNIDNKYIEAVLKLLEEGNTIPFIARYRKEVTNAMDEELIRKISEYYLYQVNLLNRKEEVIRLIEEKGLLTEEIKNNIMNASKLVEVEDLYRPFKEKKKTKATAAIEAGLEPLAKIMMSFPKAGDINTLCNKYINDKVKTKKDALEGALYIIAEWISDNAYYRKYIRNYTYQNGEIVSKIKKGSQDEAKIFEIYYDYKEAIKYIKEHRILALNRGENLKILDISINISNDKILEYLENKIIKNVSFVNQYIKNAIKDSYTRLIKPSVAREIRSDLSEKGEISTISNFSLNLEKLLMTPPIKNKVVLGFDPAFRTGCKLAVLDKTGKMLEVAVIYPTKPHDKYLESKKILLDLINKYHIDIIAIGNGTASRESEIFVAKVIQEEKLDINYIIVNEAGASVYSASKLAISEFPDLTVEKRSAISIGRRLQDPLAELVKIDPESIGVGLYQHDINKKKLSESLNFIVEKTVNNVGVNINTASSSLLEHISGLNKKNITKLLEYRNTKGYINSREEIKKKKLLTEKTYEQAIGFLRINDGVNVLDRTNIHPESYDIALKLLANINLTVNDIGTDKLITSLNNIDTSKLSKDLNVDKYTLEDIIISLKKPNLDPRDELEKPLLRNDVLNIKDLKVGYKLQGTIRNVVDFGAFVDIGLHNDGLIHISKLSKDYVKHPKDVVSVGDIVDCYVIEIDVDKERVNLSLI